MKNREIEDYFKSIESFCDKTVSIFYDSNNNYFKSDIVSKIEQSHSMQKLINSKMLDKTQKFLEDKIESMPTVLGAFIMFWVIISSMNLLIEYKDIFVFGWDYSLFFIMHFITVFVGFILGVGLITLKRRFAFIIIVFTISSFINMLFSMFSDQILLLLQGAEINFKFINFLDVGITLFFILFAGAYFFAVVMRNKKIFIN